MEPPAGAEYLREVSITRENDSEPSRTAALLAMILELYRAARETPVGEFEQLALALARALRPAERGDRAALMSHIANAMRVNRAVGPHYTDSSGAGRGRGESGLAR